MKVGQKRNDKSKLLSSESRQRHFRVKILLSRKCYAARWMRGLRVENCDYS